MLKKLKGKNIFYKLGLFPSRLEYCKGLSKKVNRLREEGNIAYLQHRSIVVNRKYNTR